MSSENIVTLLMILLIFLLGILVLVLIERKRKNTVIVEGTVLLRSMRNSMNSLPYGYPSVPQRYQVEYSYKGRTYASEAMVRGAFQELSKVHIRIRKDDPEVIVSVGHVNLSPSRGPFKRVYVLPPVFGGYSPLAHLLFFIALTLIFCVGIIFYVLKSIYLS